MLNVDSKLKIKSSESVTVLPSGLDIDFYVSFHDNFGVQFDAVQSNILLESNQKVRFAVEPCTAAGQCYLQWPESGSARWGLMRIFFKTNIRCQNIFVSCFHYINLAWKINTTQNCYFILVLKKKTSFAVF